MLSFSVSTLNLTLEKKEDMEVLRGHASLGMDDTACTVLDIIMNEVTPKHLTVKQILKVHL
jgi:hypothetical protein